MGERVEIPEKVWAHRRLADPPSGFSPLPIQSAHDWTADSFLDFFGGQPVALKGKDGDWYSIGLGFILQIYVDGAYREARKHGTADFAAERTAVVGVLRGLCCDFGDNDWSADLHLADVIEKHLAKYLWDKEKAGG